MGWFDDEKNYPIGSREYAQDYPGGYDQYGPGGPNSKSWRKYAEEYYSGGEMYSPEYDIRFYPVHAGGRKDPLTKKKDRSGKSGDPDISFRCFLTRFDDNYTSDWNSEKVYGRMDPIETFQGTSRVLNISFDVVAATTREARRNQRAISELIRGLYPIYKDEPIKAGTYTANVGIIQAPPVFKIKLANLIQDASKTQATLARDQGLLGRIASISYSPDFDSGFFTGHMLKEADKLYPQAVSMDITFHVWHTHELGYTITRGPRSGFGRFPYARGKTFTSNSASGTGAADSDNPVDNADGAVAADGTSTVASEAAAMEVPPEEVTPAVAAAEGGGGDPGTPDGADASGLGGEGQGGGEFAGLKAGALN